jgi:transposase
MSQELLYHAFEIDGYDLAGIDCSEGKTAFTLVPQARQCRCSACGSREVVRRGVVPRLIRLLPIGSQSTFAYLEVPRLECKDCGVVRQIELGFADSKKSYSHAFARHVLKLARRMTIQDVALQLGVSWDVVKGIVKSDLQRRYANPSLKDLEYLAIDEICIGKGHRYVTVVLDYATGIIVFVGEGKKADALTPFWSRLKKARAKIKAVAMDMSAAYISAVKNFLPEAQIVFDRFHLVKLLNEKITALRRELYRAATDVMQKKVLKGTRYLLLKNPENLDPLRDEPSRLREALELNEPLAQAYYLKDSLRQLWDQPSKSAASRFLNSWCLQAMTNGIRYLTDYARLLRRHQFDILNYHDYAMTTGPLEGINNKIRALQHQAYGYRDQEFFILKLLALHESKYALVG